MTRSKLFALFSLLLITAGTACSTCACVRHVHVRPGAYIWFR